MVWYPVSRMANQFAVYSEESHSPSQWISKNVLALDADKCLYDFCFSEFGIQTKQSRFS
jgi:hypothetical protein